MGKCIDNLTLGEIKEMMAILGQKPASDSSHWKVGEAYLIRTVTMILTGRLEKVTDAELVLSSAAWIPETDRYSNTVKEGKLKEVEPYAGNDVIVGRGAIIDATIWAHPLPKEQK